MSQAKIKKIRVGVASCGVAAGADAVLVVAPYYSRPSQEGVFRHYKAPAVSGTAMPSRWSKSCSTAGIRFFTAM